LENSNRKQLGELAIHMKIDSLQKFAPFAEALYLALSDPKLYDVASVTIVKFSSLQPTIVVKHLDQLISGLSRAWTLDWMDEIDTQKVINGLKELSSRAKDHQMLSHFMEMVEKETQVVTSQDLHRIVKSIVQKYLK
jgi:hypothetical protein